MKKISLIKFFVVPAILGLIFTLSYCKKDKETVTVTKYDTVTVNVHDTLYGKAITGIATYTDASSNSSPAKGAVVQLYVGSTVSGTPVVSIFADASGNFKFPYLLPGTYFIYSKYNTVNQNARLISDGFNFATNPGYVVTLDKVDMTQNIALVSITATGTAKIAMDSVANAGYGKVTCEAHSKIGFSFLDYGQKTSLIGGFNTFTMTNFVFDETTPANIQINGYVLLSGINTFEPARDALGVSGTGTNNLPNSQATGCTHGTLDNYVDSALFYNNPANSACVALGCTDTARFVSNSVVRYGDGYIAHGTLTSFYKHIANGPIGSSNYNYKSDTTGFAAAAGHPYNGPMVDGMISKPLDLYFIYNGKTKIVSGTSFYWWFVFEGEFSFKPMTDFYITSGHFADGPIKVDCHIQMQGTKGVEY